MASRLFSAPRPLEHILPLAMLTQRILRASVEAGGLRVGEVCSLQQRGLLPHICVGLLLFSLTSGGALGNFEACMRSALMSGLGNINGCDGNV